MGIIRGNRDHIVPAIFDHVVLGHVAGQIGLVGHSDLCLHSGSRNAINLYVIKSLDIGGINAFQLFGGGLLDLLESDAGVRDVLDIDIVGKAVCVTRLRSRCREFVA